MSWLPQDLIAKAARFSKLALEQHDLAHGSLLTSLAVELLCRALLAKITPYLLASSRHREQGAVYIKTGAGSSRGSSPFGPPSLESHEVLEQCASLVPGFEQVKVMCKSIAFARNADVHSGDNPWTKPEAQLLRASSYVVIDFCLKELNVGIDDFFGPHANVARECIDDYKSQLSNHWTARLYAAKKVYAGLDAEERERRIGLITGPYPFEKPEVALRACPACSQTGVMSFKIRMLTPTLNSENGCLVQQGHRTPVTFHCQVCGLIVNGSSLLCEAKMGEVENFEMEASAIDFLTREQALEQIGERFESTELLSDEQRELLREGMQTRDYYDDMNYNMRHNK